MKLELVSRQAAAQRVLETQALVRDAVQVFGIEADPRALALRAVHRDIRVLQKALGTESIVRVDTDADARRGHHFLRLDRNGLLDRLEDLVGDRGGGQRLTRAAKDAPRIRHRRALPRRRTRRTHDFRRSATQINKWSPAGVSEAVVDDLEPIEIEIQDCQPFPGAFRVRDHVVERVVKRASIEQAGERVMGRTVFELRLVVPELRYVAMRAGQQPGAPARIMGHHPAHRMQPAPVSVTSPDPIFDIDHRRLAAEMSDHRGSDGGKIFRMRESLPSFDSCGDLFLGIAEHRPELAREADFAGRHVVLPDGDLGSIERELQPLLTHLQRSLGLPQLASFSRFTRGPSDRRAKPLKTILEHIVGRSGAQGFDFIVGARRIDDQDERGFRPGALRAPSPRPACCRRSVALAIRTSNVAAATASRSPSPSFTRVTIQAKRAAPSTRSIAPAILGSCSSSRIRKAWSASVHICLALPPCLANYFAAEPTNMNFVTRATPLADRPIMRRSTHDRVTSTSPRKPFLVRSVRPEKWTDKGTTMGLARATRVDGAQRNAEVTEGNLGFPLFITGDIGAPDHERLLPRQHY